MEITLQTDFPSATPINRDWDTFTRADADVAGVTEGARLPWQILAPDPAQWRAGIRSNQLSLFRTSLPSESERALAVVDTKKADGVFSMRLRSIPGGSSSGNGNFAFRVRDHLNFMWVYANDTAQKWSLYRCINGTGQLVTEGTLTATAGLISVRMEGPKISILLDGNVSVADATYNNFLEATKHGIAVRATTSDTMSSSRFDDFSFTDL